MLSRTQGFVLTSVLPGVQMTAGAVDPFDEPLGATHGQALSGVGEGVARPRDFS